jgi:ribosomal protein L32
LDSIFEEIGFLVDTYHIDGICFCDELFAANAERLFSFCERIKRYGVGWNVNLRVSDKINLNLLQKMKEANCLSVQYGLESADDSVLKSMRKGTTVTQIFSTLENTKDAGISLAGCDFIFGDAEETAETAKNTLNWVNDNYELLEEIDLIPIILYPGSELYNNALKDGKIKDAVEFIKKGCPVTNVSKMTDPEFNQLVNFELPKTRSILRKKVYCSSKLKYNEKISGLAYALEYIHSHTCDSCGNEVISHVPPQHITFIRKVCPNCGKIFKSYSAIPYFQAFEEKITKILSRRNIAIWGAGALLHELYQANDFFRNNDVVIVDSSFSKQDYGFYGKPVFSPAKIDDVTSILYVVSSPTYRLLYNHKDIFRNVRDFYWIYDIGLM